jgi:Uma2 family endonuclease
MSLHAIIEEFPERSIVRIDRRAWRALIDAGAFAGRRAELIRGVIVQMSPQNPPHARVIQNLTRALFEALGRRADVRCQLPVVAADESEPEPDLAVVPMETASGDHPRVVHLVVEVADSTLRFDRAAKRPLYAESGFPEYWIVDVERRQIEVYRHPEGQSYATCSVVDADSEATIAAFPDVRVAVSALFVGVPARAR